ncbi:hypothetical protein V1506DRAFT_544948 [Lipomyces tetrasporus]
MPYHEDSRLFTAVTDHLLSLLQVRKGFQKAVFQRLVFYEPTEKSQMLKQPASAVAPGSASAPNTGDKSTSQSPVKPASTEVRQPSINAGKQSQTLCRNILIHGYCKYENSGCIFRHDTTPVQQQQSTAKSESSRKRLNVDSPSFMPGSIAPGSAATKSTLSVPSADSAIFVPRMSTPVSDNQSNSYTSPTAVDAYGQKPIINSQFVHGYSPMAQMAPHVGVDPSPVQQPIQTPTYEYGSMGPYAQPSQDIYYQQAQPAHYQPLNYHLYAPLSPYKVNLLPYQRTVQGFFLSDNLREELQRKTEASLQVLPTSGLPDSLDVYYSLVPLDTNTEKSSRVFGYASWIYKAFSKSDGNTYALRRLEGFKLTDEKAIATVQQWRRLSNAGIVTLFEAFTTRAFGDNSIIFVYDYHPLSSTLFDTHFGPDARYPMSRNGSSPVVPEQVVWSYIVQLSSALKSIHSANLAARVLDASKVILTSKMRVRLSAVGIMDVISGNDYSGGAESIQALHQDDLYNLGRLILSIVCNNHAISANANVPQQVIAKSLEYAGRSYSVGLKTALAYLLGNNVVSAGSVGNDGLKEPVKNIDEFLRIIAPHLQQSFNSSLHYQDGLESELCKELENGRLVRLLCKFNFINERPEYDHDSAWSETGDRYLLKLFRDYVFHQNDENGHPVTDLGHVLRCLNKLDAAVDEKVMLVSRDEQSCLIVSYKELKNCVDAVFRDLSRSNG